MDPYDRPKKSFWDGLLGDSFDSGFNFAIEIPFSDNIPQLTIEAHN